ncbi:MAG: 1-deoxy-D-xylulose-5-phosphate reductoisomerase [Bacteroidales bacterium]
MKKRIAIFGSTGSIGTQALEVIQQHSDLFEPLVLTAGSNANLLIEQALRFVPAYVVIADETKYAVVRDALARLPVKVLAGQKALNDMATLAETDVVLAALVGFSGLLPTLNAVKCGRNVALANKETLVVAGALITSLAKTTGSEIYPVDSEHSAIFQCLAGEDPQRIEKLILTASGGPFRGMDRKHLEQVTSAQALKHPNWCMGNKVTIDSASLMNKGLEVIEASWLFGIQPERIDVVIHPQSIIHSMVQFTDGSIKAQMGLPDMRLPIQYALGYPNRLPSDFPRFSFSDCSQLTFEKPDMGLFRNLSLAYEALGKGGNMPCIMNAANEVVVEAFLNNRTGFMEMTGIIEKTMEKVRFIPTPAIEDYQETDREARSVALEMLKSKI